MDPVTDRLLIVSGRDYEFANDLIQEVMYATTPEPTRLAYHRRAADLLTGQPESLARHAAAAGDWLRAARAWLLAAEDALRRYAARWVRVDVWTTNVALHAYYEQQGFEFYGFCEAVAEYPSAALFQKPTDRIKPADGTLFQVASPGG